MAMLCREVLCVHHTGCVFGDLYGLVPALVLRAIERRRSWESQRRCISSDEWSLHTIGHCHASRTAKEVRLGNLCAFQVFLVWITA